jgi:hypothetical protein
LRFIGTRLGHDQPELFDKFGLGGLLSATKVQQAAAEAVADGLDHTLIEKLAELGGYGSCPRNIQSQLLRRFSQDVDPKHIIYRIPGGLVTAMIAPHELFYKIYEKYPLQFKLRS